MIEGLQPVGDLVESCFDDVSRSHRPRRCISSVISRVNRYFVPIRDSLRDADAFKSHVYATSCRPTDSKTPSAYIVNVVLFMLLLQSILKQKFATKEAQHVTTCNFDIMLF